MGEHPNDLTIEEILENEAKERARSLAEEEVVFIIVLDLSKHCLAYSILFDKLVLQTRLLYSL